MTFTRDGQPLAGELIGTYLNGDTTAEFVIEPALNPNIVFIDTDYTSYALQYSCENKESKGKVESAFIFCKCFVRVEYGSMIGSFK